MRPFRQAVAPIFPGRKGQMVRFEFSVQNGAASPNQSTLERPVLDHPRRRVVHGVISPRFHLGDSACARIHFNGDTRVPRIAGSVLVAEAEDRRVALATPSAISRHAVSHGFALGLQFLMRTKLDDAPVAAVKHERCLMTWHSPPARGGEPRQLPTLGGSTHLCFRQKVAVGVEQMGDKSGAMTDQITQRSSQQKRGMHRPTVLLDAAQSVGAERKHTRVLVTRACEFRHKSHPPGVPAQLFHDAAGEHRRAQSRRSPKFPQLSLPDGL